MEIKAIRVVDNRLPTPQGEITGPTTYFMDVAVSEVETVAVPIDLGTFVSLTDITAEHEPPEEATTTPMGTPT